MKKRKSQTFEILDKMWDSLSHLNVQPETTWNDVVDACSTEHTEDYIKKLAIEKFLFETKYVYKKPNRETMEYLWGDHISLFHIFGCKIHKFTGKSYDSYDGYVDGLTIFCPECNRTKFTNDERKERYIKLLSGKFCSDEEYEYIMEATRIRRKFERKDNFQYKLKQLKNWNYIKYKIKLFIKKLKEEK